MTLLNGREELLMFIMILLRHGNSFVFRMHAVYMGMGSI